MTLEEYFNLPKEITYDKTIELLRLLEEAEKCVDRLREIRINLYESSVDKVACLNEHKPLNYLIEEIK